VICPVAAPESMDQSSTGGHSETAEHKDEQTKGPAGLPGRPTVDSLEKCWSPGNKSIGAQRSKLASESRYCHNCQFTEMRNHTYLDF